MLVSMNGIATLLLCMTSGKIDKKYIIHLLCTLLVGPAYSKLMIPLRIVFQ